MTHSDHAGHCDNCGRLAALYRRLLPGGALVYDCHKCMALKVNNQPRVLIKVEVDSVRQAPICYCAACGLKAPRTVVQGHPSLGNLLGIGPVEQNNLTGWMVIDFPFHDPYMNRQPGVDGGTRWVEKTKLCPKCAAHIVGTIHHLSVPMRGEDE